MDFNSMSNEELLKLYQSEKAARQRNVAPSPGITSNPDINGLIAKATGKNAGGRLGDAISILGGGKPEADYGDLYAKAALKADIDKRFEDPEKVALDRRLKTAQAAAYEEMVKDTNQPPPKGFVRAGGKIVQDPTYVDPDKPESPIIEARRIKATDDLYETVGKANQRYSQIEQGMASAPRLPQGLLGKAQLQWMKWFDANNPTLADWQNMKSILTDAQLQNVAKTKGAVSDYEMNLFAQSVANDDIASAMRQSKVLDAFKKAVFEEQEGKLNAFKRNFNEDPRSWEELNARNPFEKPAVSSIVPNTGISQIPAESQASTPVLSPEQQAKRERIRQKYGV